MVRTGIFLIYLILHIKVKPRIKTVPTCPSFGLYPETESGESVSIGCGNDQLGNKTRICLESITPEWSSETTDCSNKQLLF